jgi:Ca-activated chloride channel homolog
LRHRRTRCGAEDATVQRRRHDRFRCVRVNGRVTRIDEVRSALGAVLPSATKFRRVGLTPYGPGPYQQCNVRLDLKPSPDAARAIMGMVNSLTPTGRTPLAAVEQAANVLDYRNKPGVVVVVTDGEETCGGSPCDLGKKLHAGASELTVHVIGYRPKGFSWTGEESILGAKCLADENGGLYIAAVTKDDLIEALEKTLGCPMVTQHAAPARGGPSSEASLAIPRLASEAMPQRPDH